jgi:uroporphyrinogen III methyltransferase/synthase
VSLPDQKLFFTSIGELRLSAMKYPSPVLVIAGEVVALESRKERNRKVLLTGTVRGDYAGKGAVVHTPLIRIQKNADKTQKNENGNLTATLHRQTVEQDWIVFTRRYWVHYFFDAMHEAQCDIRSLSSVKIASVGKTTSAELAKHGIYPDLEPATESAEGLIALFAEHGVKNRRILLPRSDKGLKYLSDGLEKLGNRVTDIPVYTNTFNDKAEKVDLSQFGKIVFASPSAVDAFRTLYGELPQGIQLVARGDTTRNKILHEIK